MKDIRDEEQIMPEEMSDYDRKLQAEYALDAFDPLAGGSMRPSAIAAIISLITILAVITFY